MRCPYCRQIMADTSERCARCGAVARDGRWVRGATAGDRAAGTDRAAPPVAGHAPAQPPPGAGGGTPAGAGARAAPPSTTGSGRAGRGCGIAAVVAGIVVALALAGGLLAVIGLSRSDPAGAPVAAPGSTWSAAGVDRFEAVCRSGGTDAHACRCLRTELEERFTEAQVDAMVAKLGRGEPVSADVERRFREAERACGAS